MHELSALLSCNDKQPPVDSDSMSPEWMVALKRSNCNPFQISEQCAKALLLNELLESPNKNTTSIT